MSHKSPPLFYEKQIFKHSRVRYLLAILPAAFLLLLIWQVILRHPTGRQPLSNGNVIGWTVFLWLVYLRLITLKLVTEVHAGNLHLSMHGLWSIRKIPLAGIGSAEVVIYDPVKDYGGYGIRLSPRGRAYIASGNRGVRLTLMKGMKVLVGSQRPQELAQAIAAGCGST
jgi:hypothetical protein